MQVWIGEACLQVPSAALPGSSQRGRTNRCVDSALWPAQCGDGFPQGRVKVILCSEESMIYFDYMEIKT